MFRSFVNDQKLQRRGSSVSSPLREGQELRGDLTPSPGQDASWLLLGEVVLARPFRRRLNLSDGLETLWDPPAGAVEEAGDRGIWATEAASPNVRT